MAELKRESEDINVRLVEAPSAIPDVHRGIAAIYKAQGCSATNALGGPDTRRHASSDIRSLVGKIVIYPADKRSGDSATLLGSRIGILERQIHNRA